MPLYEYRCTQCGHVFEKIQSFSAPDEKECPKCKGPVERLLSAPAIQFKGSGFYLTDYGKAGGAPKGGASSESKGDGGASSSKGDGAGSASGAAASGGSSSATSSSTSPSTPASGSSKSGSSGSGSSSTGSGGSGTS